MNYSIALLSLAGVDYLLLPLYTRVLTPADYGLLSIISVFIRLLLILFPLGQDAALVRYYFDYKDTPQALKSYLGTLVIFILTASLFWMILILSVGEWLSTLLVKGIPPSYIAWASWIAFSSLVFTLWLRLLQAREQSGKYLFLTSSNAALKILFVSYFLVVAQQGLRGWLKASLCVALILFAVSVWALRRAMTWSIDLVKLTSSLRYGIPILIHTLSGWSTSFANRFILVYFATLTTVASYHIGYTLASIMSLMVTSYNYAYAPFFMSLATAKGEEPKAIFRRLSTYYLMLVMPIALALSFFSREVIALLATKAYPNAYKVVPIVVFSYVVTGVYFLIINPVFYAKEVTKYLPIITLSGAGVNILLNLLLIPRFQMMGAAWAGFITAIAVVLLAWPISHKAYPIQFEYRRVCGLLIITVPVLVLGLAVDSLALNVWGAITLKALILLSHPVLLVAIGVLKRSELKRLWEICTQLRAGSIPPHGG